jgi:hypothetical protein
LWNVEGLLDDLVRHVLRDTVELSRVVNSRGLEAVEINHLGHRGESLEDAIV